MSHDRRINNRPAEFSRTDLSAIKLDFGVYLGIVKNNIDPDRKGRLQVWVPDFGGDEAQSFNWRTVSYASPYMGSTYYSQNTSKETTFNTVNHTYGMWMIPPDLDSQVLITFINGRPDKGYWFACVSPHASHNMMPALAASDKWSESQVRNELPADIQKQVVTGEKYPSLEFNENNPNLRTEKFQTDNPRPLHRAQFARLVEQGLENDPTRGTTTSSSQREAPSNVFGFSTPGRPDPDPKTNKELLKKIAENKVKPEDYRVTKRQGGHVFVLDDGTVDGQDQQIRLRTAGGHQIVMHDSDDTMYISNSNGSVWIELSNSGQLHIFSSNGVNLRTQGDLNLHSDRDVNINAGGSISCKAANSIRVESDSTSLSSVNSTTLYATNIEMLANQDIRGSTPNGGVFWNSDPVVVAPPGIPVKELPDTYKDPDTNKWRSVEKKLTSIVSVAPTHEPYARKSGTTVTNGNNNAAPADAAGADTAATTGSSAAAPAVGENAQVNQATANTPTLSAIEKSANQLAVTPSGQVTDTATGAAPGASSASKDAGPSAAQGKPVKNKLPLAKLAEQPVPKDGLGPLSVSEVRALMGQLGNLESTMDYSKVNEQGYLGKYQFGAAALVDRGYIHKDYYDRYGQAALDMDLAWTGKNNIKAKDNWLANSSIQEQTMYEQMKANYQQLVNNQSIKPGDDKSVISGMLSVAHLLGPNKGTSTRPGAATWRSTGTGTDANGTSGADYYNAGRYAMEVLAKGSGS